MTEIGNSSDGVHSSRRIRTRRLPWLITALIMILLSVAIRVWFSESDQPEIPTVQSFDPGGGNQPAPLIIATWNINYNNQDIDEVVRLLRDSDADMICLQETTERSETILKRELAELYPSQFTAGHAGRFLAEGFQVLSKQPILNPRFVPPVQTYFGHVAFEIDYVFYSHHFTPIAANLERCRSSDHHLLIGKLQCAP